MPETEITQLRREIAEVAEKIRVAHEEDDMVSFHLFLGMIMGQGERLYEANEKAAAVETKRRMTWGPDHPSYDEMGQ